MVGFLPARAPTRSWRSEIVRPEYNSFPLIPVSGSAVSFA
jgi:hypothetical protein